MRIVLINECFTKSMGYLENKLTRAFVRLGHEVHLVTSDLQAYHQIPEYKVTFEKYQGPAIQPCGTELWEGVWVHRLPHRMLLGYVRLVGLWRYLKRLQPDIVQTLAVASWLPLEAALAKPYCGYQLFTGAHQAASVLTPGLMSCGRLSRMRIRSDIRRALPGRIVSLMTEKCYGVTVDCAEIAWRFYGVQKKKVEIMHLGVETNLFCPVDRQNEAGNRERLELRRRLGFSDDEIVCIYTGKMTERKNGLVLARAIERLRSQGHPYRGLFIGDGPQKEQIRQVPGNITIDFMGYRELPPYYRAADIGVWPTDESISMLDAAACGLPLIVSDGIVYRDHVEGNGLVYKMNDLSDLLRTLLELRSPEYRQRLGAASSAKMKSHFSIESIALRRLHDYEEALARNSAQQGLPTRDHCIPSNPSGQETRKI